MSDEDASVYVGDIVEYLKTLGKPALKAALENVDRGQLIFTKLHRRINAALGVDEGVETKETVKDPLGFNDMQVTSNSLVSGFTGKLKRRTCKQQLISI